MRFLFASAGLIEQRSQSNLSARKRLSASERLGGRPTSWLAYGVEASTLGRGAGNTPKHGSLRQTLSMTLRRTLPTAAVCAILTALGAAGAPLAGAVVKHHHGMKHHHAGRHYVPGKRYVA